jgi:hypothetical protein
VETHFEGRHRRGKRRDNSPGDGTSLPTFTTILPSLEVFKESTVMGNRSMICKSKVEEKGDHA